jgi:choline dehydrogenase-like flavoprotein
MFIHYDVIIIGTGAGGGTLAYKLAPSGKKILLLERGGYLPREKDNWSSRAVFVENKYKAKVSWKDKNGNTFHPGIHYYVGGNTKVYGAALLRFRKQGFEAIKHHGGISPAWPIRYEDMEPYYTQAEHLYHVHGDRGEDPTEPPAGAPYRYPALPHEPRIQALHEDWQKLGSRPFHLPVGVMRDEARLERAPCIRCNTCDGVPCPLNAKADAQVICVDLALTYPNVTLHHECARDKARGKRLGPRGDRRRCGAEWRNRYLSRRPRRRVLRRDQFGGALAALGERHTSQRPGQFIRRGRSALHVPQQFGHAGDLEKAQPDRVAEDHRPE